MPYDTNGTWVFIPDDAFAQSGDIIQSGNISTQNIWDARSFCMHVQEFSVSNTWVRAIGFVVEGLCGLTVNQIKKFVRDGCSSQDNHYYHLYALRHVTTIDPELVLTIRNAGVNPELVRPAGEESFMPDSAAPRKAEKRINRYRMNPIHSKAHPFFSRGSNSYGSLDQSDTEF